VIVLGEDTKDFNKKYKEALKESAREYKKKTKPFKTKPLTKKDIDNYAFWLRKK